MNNVSTSDSRRSRVMRLVRLALLAVALVIAIRAYNDKHVAGMALAALLALDLPGVMRLYDDANRRRQAASGDAAGADTARHSVGDRRSGAHLARGPVPAGV